MINWFDMPAEGLSNGGLFEIKELTATENKVYQKDGEVYNKVTVNVEGGGGSSDLNNPILLELTEINDTLVTVLTAGEIYALCQTGTPYFTVTAEQKEEYSADYSVGSKYFINEYFEDEDSGVKIYGFFFAMLGIADTTTESIRTNLNWVDAPIEENKEVLVAEK